MFKLLINSLLKGVGYKIVKLNKKGPFPPDMEKDFLLLYEKCKNFTMVTPVRMYSLYQATKYVVNNKIPGVIVECGVWKGGCCMFAALTLLKTGDTKRKIYLYDTFTGMPKPSSKDKSYNGKLALVKWKKLQNCRINKWCYSPLEEVKRNLYSTGYPKEKLVFVKGRVEVTIPKIAPKKIALLRLDTDWYQSTYHQLSYLFPRLSPKGVLIIDDYGRWQGAREATDKYLREKNIHLLLHRADAERMAIKI